ncbi:hypothetical protein IRM70_02065 [Erwinia amylovora]|nr:hypothetical protein IRM70_02065 [Erwinia amylovora]
MCIYLNLMILIKIIRGFIRIKFQMAEGFIEGCLSMLDVRLEME